MLKTLKTKKAASIVEVIVTSVVFVIAAVGILSTIGALRPQSEESTKRLEAAYVGKSIIEDLHSQIDASTWNTPGSAFEPGITHSRSEGDFTVTYKLTDDATTGGRYLTMNITYPD